MKALVIDLGGTHANCAVVEDRMVLASETIVPPEDNRLSSLLPRLAKTLHQLGEKAGLQANRAEGIAFGFCGIVNSNECRVTATNGKYPDTPEIALGEWAPKEFGLPLRLENDARMALLGEHYAGAAEGFEDVVMVTLGTGIGAAAMIGGRLLRGKHFQAGCLGGHLPVMLRGRECSCGGEGCAESEAAGWSLPFVCQHWPAFEKSTLAKQEINFEVLFRCAAAGDAIAQEIRQHCLEVWTANAVGLIHAYDPEVLVYGGGVMRSGSVILPYLREYVPPRVWTPWGKAEIRGARLGSNAALLGAIPLLADAALKRPDVR